MHVLSSWSIVYAREASGPLADFSFREWHPAHKGKTVAQCQRPVAPYLTGSVSLGDGHAFERVPCVGTR